ncbi:hypothetical protein AeMF1_007460, partial [Aphanomyces euteiches]
TGGKAKNSPNKASATYGTGYCNAQCPHDIKFINSEADAKNWVPRTSGQNSGSGQHGSCCEETDIWESNSTSQASTSRPKTVTGQYRCLSPTECGDDATGNRSDGVCDKDGCDFNTYRLNDHTFYGPGFNFNVDSPKLVTVVTQFITIDGNLVKIKRFHVQNSKGIDNSAFNWSGIDATVQPSQDCVWRRQRPLEEERVKGHGRRGKEGCGVDHEFVGGLHRQLLVIGLDVADQQEPISPVYKTHTGSPSLPRVQELVTS